ncbi:class I SAM-dependent methyltransferase [Algoriphagus sp. Y33]|uniref:class I SAM-dependent methyltransferase n=1 Tax=Algoriphagus sp. Y33 TaxID=2772483 RepID=UPI0017877515|nr:class I SAM-dependent methyltransferase [Algoriphagus sp. Y33]
MEEKKMASNEWAKDRGSKWNDNLLGMEAMIAPVDVPLLDALDLDRPYYIADLGCGGGTTSLNILKAAPERSVVHGYDISDSLISTATERIPENTSNLTFTTLDISQPPKQTGNYDRLISRFGLMFFPDPQKAFGNISKWLRPDGKFVFAVWGSLKENQWVNYVKESISEVMEVPSTKPDSPGPFRYANTDDFIPVLENAGFKQLRINTWKGNLPVGGNLSAKDAAHFALNAFSMGELLSTVHEKEKQHVEKKLAEKYSGHLNNGIVEVPASVHLISGGV